MTKGLNVLIAVALFGYAHSSAQVPNIENSLAMIERGQADAVRAELPSLLNKYPLDAGVQYVQAVLTTDGAEAVRMYQSIVDNFPKSEWADDALFKVYKFYQAIGLYRTAEIKLNQLKTNYPNSNYVTASAEAKQIAEKIETSQPPTTYPQRTSEETSTPNVVEKHKTADTKVETPGTEPSKPGLFSGVYAVQVGVFSTRANANKQKKFFEYQNYSVEVTNKMKGSKELFYVYIGSYATADEAKTQGDEIKKSFNIDYIVVTR